MYLHLEYHNTTNISTQGVDGGATRVSIKNLNSRVATQTINRYACGIHNNEIELAKANKIQFNFNLKGGLFKGSTLM